MEVIRRRYTGAPSNISYLNHSNRIAAGSVGKVCLEAGRDIWLAEISIITDEEPIMTIAVTIQLINAVGGKKGKKTTSLL